MIETKVQKIIGMLDNLLEQVKNTYVYNPDIYKDVRDVQVQIVLLAKELKNPECKKVLHRAFQELSDAYYTIRWYGKQEKRLVVKTAKCKFKIAKELVSAITPETCA
ncbi:MAG: hypothetical protein OWS74_06765 [Firmicutes bacterium]|nr:hypothetical protein [Bacillota bacterium]